jgi:tRNA pseudouridine38-40 synthase
MKYFAKIKYLGTAFHGFQVQPDKRTVQGELCRALAEATGSECKVTGCSRTDAGVHANEFCLTVESEGATVPPEKLSLAVARFLPEDLSLFYAKECSNDFHPRYDVKEKEYLYRIINQPIYDPFEYGRAWFLPRFINEEKIALMNLAAKKIVGKHDFSAFMSEGSDVEDTVRNVSSLTVEKKGSLIEVRIRADGFLYNMVRIIVGTAIDVSEGRLSPNCAEEIFLTGKREKAGKTAPPQGLFLNKVFY